MEELKTKQTARSVPAFLKRVADEKRRAECQTLVKLMKDVTQSGPKMWGSSIVGFGSYRYKYPTGREGEWFITGFSPRKQNLTVYIMPGLGRFGELLTKLGKHKTGKSCLYIKRLEDIDLSVLREMIAVGFANMTKTF